MKLRLTLLAVLLPFFSGCIVLPLPHLDERSPEVSGKIIDANTRQPVQWARVEFIENPSLAVYTDETGEFVIRRTRKPELFVSVFPPPGSLDFGAKIPPRLRITHENYLLREVDASDLANLDFSQGSPAIASPREDLIGPLLLKPIALEPLTPSPLPKGLE